jgi:hypothetical protein
MQSSYAKDGNALRLALGYAPGGWDFSLDYINVDPWYDPMIFQFPANGILMRQLPDTWGIPNRQNGIAGVFYRFPDLNYFPIGYALHDTELLPHNRQGFRLKVSRAFGRDGKAWAELGSLEQQRSSVPDIRVAWADGGFSPGFIDPVFFPIRGVDARLNHYEDKKGRSGSWGVGASLTLPAGGLHVDCSYRAWQFSRDSTLSAYPISEIASSSRNKVDLGLKCGSINLSCPIAFDEKNAPRFTLEGGYSWSIMKGHYEPGGAYRPYAESTGTNDFTNVDTRQDSSWIGFDYAVSRDVNWRTNFRFINTTDALLTEFPRSQFYHHPFSWKGLQVTSELKMKL